MHLTADDASYIQPFRNWLEIGEWKDNSVGASSFIQRPPLLGLLYGLFESAFGANVGAAWFSFTAIVQALSGVMFYSILRNRLVNNRVTFLYLFVLFPPLFGFAGYRITESIIPFLLTYSVYAFFGYPKKNRIHQIASILLLYLTRPVLMLLILPLAVRRIYLWWPTKKWNKEVVLALLISLSIVGCWEGRKMIIADSVWNPHPIYHETNESLFREPHKSMTDLFRCWEWKSEEFHHWMAICDAGTLEKKDSSEFLYYLNERKVGSVFQELFPLMLEFQSTQAEVKSHFGSKLKLTNSEKDLVDRICDINGRFRAKNWWKVYVITPFNSMIHLVSKSQLNSQVFQKEFRGNILMESFRVLVFIVLLALYSSIILAFFSRKRSYRQLALGAVLYAFILFWVQVLNEDRYMLPLIVIGAILLPTSVRALRNLLPRKKASI